MCPGSLILVRSGTSKRFLPVPDLFRSEVNVMGETTNARLINPAVILVATDLSDLHRIVPFAIQMAEKTGARLELLHILQFGGEFTTDAAGMPYYDREGAFSIAMNMLQPW